MNGPERPPIEAKLLAPDEFVHAAYTNILFCLRAEGPETIPDQLCPGSYDRLSGDFILDSGLFFDAQQ
jgi:hypothetical protein